MDFTSLEIAGYNLKSLDTSDDAWRQVLDIHKAGRYLDYYRQFYSPAEFEVEMENLEGQEPGQLLTRRMNSIYAKAHPMGWFTGDRLWAFAVISIFTVTHTKAISFYAREINVDISAPDDLLLQLGPAFLQCARDNNCRAMRVSVPHHASRMRRSLEENDVQMTLTEMDFFL